MARDPQPIDFASMFRIDVSPSGSSTTENEGNLGEAMVGLMRQLVAGQSRQNQLLEELVTHMSAAQKQRQLELGQWKEANPGLSRACRQAAETLSRVQTQFLDNLTVEVTENEDSLLDGEFMLNEFVDRFGPRLAHLNGVLQVLSQLSSIPNSTNTVQ
jgi:hypothetical protein